MDKMRRLEIFVTVANAGRFSRAANRLGLSTSAVSHAIKSLEEHLGVSLIRRDNRNFSLTDAGIDYWQIVSPLLDQFQEADERLRNSDKELRGDIRISAPVSFGEIVLRPLIARFLEHHSDVTIQLNLTDRFVDLRHEQYDLALRIAQLKDSSLSSKRIATTKMRLCASPSYVEKHPAVQRSVNFDSIDALIYEQTPEWQVYRNGKLCRVRPKGRLSTTSGEAIAGFAADGMGVAYLPDFIVNERIAKGQLIQICPEISGQEYGVHLLFPERRLRAYRIQALSEFLRDGLRQSGWR